MEINERIKARRLQLNLTLKDVADALNVAESTVSRYETSDIRNMGIDKIKALADVLACTPGYLMGWEEPQEFDRLKYYSKEFAQLLTDERSKSLLMDFRLLPKTKQEIVLELVHSMLPDEHPEQSHTNNRECN